ncbi:chitinase 2-like [Senna tora]|uniref:Chitinase 2-like n=1 Tax=Senna tora TaxID=362788 RepID=A0A834WX69_9FABA|nr:chitinase 2-like [Senna tora]
MVMAPNKFCFNLFFFFQAFIFFFFSFLTSTKAANNNSVFREYIGAQFKNVTFSDVPVNPNVQFHFILAFAIDYDASNSASPTPTNGNFSIFWDTQNLSPSHVSSIKTQYSNVGLSLGGYSINNLPVNFTPNSVDSWVSNAVSSLTAIIQQYDLDGIDIDYENFYADSDPNTFSECIGRLIQTLKTNKVITFASIAPFDDPQVQTQYQALWNSSYGHLIDYVNFQFYAYDKSTNVSQFIDYFNTQSKNYEGGDVLVSFESDGLRGLTPDNGFFDACEELKSEGKLNGIFVWCADDSKANGFVYEQKSQEILVAS